MTNTIYFWNPSKEFISDIAEIRAMHPNASIPDGADISVLGFFPIRETQSPNYNVLTQALAYTIVQKFDAVEGPYYERNYTVIELPKEEQDKNKIENLNKLKKLFVEIAQLKLDEFAREKGYDDIKSAVTYANSTVPKFKQEADICIVKRDQTWGALYLLLDKLEKAEIDVPESFSDIEQFLPELVWE